MSLFSPNKDFKVRGVVLKLVNSNCPELVSQIEDVRADRRVNLAIVVAVVPIDKGKIQGNEAFTAVTKDFSSTGVAVVTERPLFSGYVFARFLLESRITVISTPGVVRSLGDEGGNLVNSAELDKIREGLASGLLLRPHPNVSVGARVRIRAGIFEGVEGVVTEFRQQCKVIIALAAVQQCFSLEVEVGDIEVLKKPPVRLNLSSCDVYGYWNLQTAKP